MYRTLTDSQGVIGPDNPRYETALEAERDFQVLGFVFEMAAAHPTDSKFRELIKNVLNDSVLPQDNRNQSKGRDFQFELFVAAICQNAGLTPVEREEPDVTCTVDRVKYGIAAKRVKSAGNLRKRIQKGADQIQKAGLPGIIALETSLLFNQDNVRISLPISDAQFGPLYEQALRNHIERYQDKIQEWVRGKGVRGVVFHDQQVRFDPTGEWSLAGMTMTLSTAQLNQRRNREFRSFEQKYLKGLPNRL
ncbi:MAG: hypothetical protein ABIP48_33415 [Planctomycetota bacterium]